MEELFLPDFWARVSAKQNQGQRKGQAVFNVAADMFPQEVNLLSGSLCDPFYRDANVGEFLTQLVDLLTK